MQNFVIVVVVVVVIVILETFRDYCLEMNLYYHKDMLDQHNTYPLEPDNIVMLAWKSLW